MVEKAAAGHNVYEDILNIPLMIRIPGKTVRGKHTAELVTLTDIMPTLIDILDLKTPKLNNKLEGLSLEKLILKGKSIDREFIVSESWFQSTIITKSKKLGIMQENLVNPKQDYRDFGDMFFDRITDPLEIKNGINDPKNKNDIEILKDYFNDFKNKVSGLGFKEITNKLKNGNTKNENPR